MALDDPFSMRRVRSPQDWRAARALRFEGLAARGEIAPTAQRAYADPFDESPGTSTWLLTSAGQPLGTTRSSASAPGSTAALPAHGVFAAEIEAAFGREAVVAEASLTFVDARAARDPQDALMRLFKVHMLRCAAERADALVVVVRDSQIGFYRRRFGMEILSGAERCPGLHTPRVLMGISWPEKAPILLRRIPALAATAEDEAEFERP